MKSTFLFFLTVLIAGCDGRSNDAHVTPVPQSSANEVVANDPNAQVAESESGVSTATGKSDASPEGLDRAVADVARLKMKLRSMAPNELIAAFIPSPQKRKYGGYEYYYGFMANMAIRKEIETRADDMIPALRAQIENATHIAEAINGPGDTIGRICQMELQRRSSTGSVAKPPREMDAEQTDEREPE